MNRRDFLHLLGASTTLAALPTAVRAYQDSELTSVFGELPAPSNVERVFAAGPPAAILVSMLAPEKLLGWPQQIGTQEKRWLLPSLQKLPQIGRLAIRGSTVPLERLLALRPNLIVDIGDVNDSYRSIARTVFQQTGIPYVLLRCRLPDTATQLLALGQLLGVGERATILAQYAQQTFDLAQAHREALSQQGHRPSVYYSRSSNGLETALSNSINGEIFDFVGTHNVASATGRSGISRVSFEHLLRWDPDFIISHDADFVSTTATSALWQQLSAVREQRVLLAPSEPFGWLDLPPAANRLIGVRWLLSRLYNDPDPRSFAAEANAFYQLFYGTPAQMQAPSGL